ncbi:hypothetical protein F444_19468 [Phytophthora nicotianae P1976]|uniref:Chromo domain-containing protein n=1 Tax=Phytophthora nicotianae P1976 TaxID=1317066 RepID=A0A080Z7P4_PHYNI|nr:hypothetical protein F444_19468 [Phytophthora nicotianae P1976]
MGGGLLEERVQGGLFGANQARRGRGGELYEVERLYAKRWVNMKTYYLVQWVGYRELTWEPSRNNPCAYAFRSSENRSTSCGCINRQEVDDRAAGTKTPPDAVSGSRT